MKNMQLYITLLLSCFILATGCTKLSDINPQGAYTDRTFWSTSSDVRAALNGCYTQMEEAQNILFTDCMTDNAIFTYGPVSYEKFANGRVGNTFVYPGLYDYKCIYACNWFLENVDRAPSNEVLEDTKNKCKAEVRFIRAYRYFILSQYFRNVPLVLQTQSVSEARKQKPATKAAITDYIIKELSEIAKTLPLNYADDADIGRATSGAALALKSRIELYNQKYTDCIATCNQLMSAPYTYALHPDFEGIFRPQNYNNSEVILAIQHVKELKPNTALSQYAVFPIGESKVGITQDLVDAFETKNGLTIQNDPTYDPLQPYANRDPRLDGSIIRPGLLYMNVYFDPITPPDQPSFPPMGGGTGYQLSPENYRRNTMNSPTGYNLKKYLNNLNDYYNNMFGSESFYSWPMGPGGNTIILRYAEVLLNFAEAKIESGKIDATVLEAINKVRERAGMPQATATQYAGQSELRTLIRRERRVEFLGEGQRWFDIVRWKIGMETMNKPVTSCPDGTVDRTNGNLSLTANSNEVLYRRMFTPKYYVFPIPMAELSLNTNLVQNIEYQ